MRSTAIQSVFLTSTLALLLTIALPAQARERPLTACGTLDQPGTTYVLQKNVSSPGTCFLVIADQITLDLNHHTVTYGTAATWTPDQETTEHVHGILGQACWDTAGHADPKLCGDGFSFLTVKNGSVVQAERAPPYSHGIRLGQGNMRALTLENVRIRVYSPSSAGVLVQGGRGGNRFHDLIVENQSVSVLNRHQLEGMAMRIMDIAKDGEPDSIDGLQVISGPQGGVVETASGTRISGSHIALTGAFTNDFGVMLLGDRNTATNNTIAGRSRGIQADARDAKVENNVIDTFESPVNEEYRGCQLEGTFGIQLEARAARALVRNNDVLVRAAACDARAFRATETKSGNGNRSQGNTYRAIKELPPAAPDRKGQAAKANTEPDRPPGKAVAASFSGAKDVLLVGDTLEADTWNAEINWDGAQNVVLRGVTFIKGAHAGPDYATFALLPGSNNAKYQRTSAEMKVIDPIFRNGASADSFFMHPIGFEKWGMPAEYSIQWSFQLTVVGADHAPVPGATVMITDQKGAPVTQSVTGADGRIASLLLTEFRRFNTPRGIQKEVFTYKVALSLGERRREFNLHIAEPTQRVEILR